MAIGTYPKFCGNALLSEVFNDPQVQEHFPKLYAKYRELEAKQPPIFFHRFTIDDLFYPTGRKWIKRLTGVTDEQIQGWYDKFWDLFDAHDRHNRDCLCEVRQYQERGIPLHPEVQKEYDELQQNQDVM